LADPNRAFSYQYLPNDGVGLVRLEFIINSTIGIHPKALLQFKNLPTKLKQKIQPHTAAYKSHTEFYIEKLREGIATIAAAFFPKPVIVRFSDFKSNEYANLLGGNLFEPHEENPMIGFRGGSRYLAKQFADCFALECEALKRVRKMGLINTKVMLPFTRTVEEATQLVDLLEKTGLKRGADDLEVILMCEIPSNALLADEFLEICDGFSIGSNDLTQLTLGLDRDSSLVAHLFDERNPAVKKLLHQAIQTCKQKGKYIGICGQAPSDYPKFAKWLLDEGIESISLTPDSLVETWLYLGKKTK
jgi:pyruvate,water dikinase